MPFKMHEINFFFQKKEIKICVPTLPKISRPDTRNTLIFFIWPKYEGHPIKNETFAIAQWIYMLDLRNLIQS